MMHIIEDFKQIIVAPRALFAKAFDYHEVFLYMVCLVAISALLAMGVDFFTLGYVSSVGAFFEFALQVAAFFVFAAIWFMWLHLWGGKGTFLQTFSVIVYAATPGLLLFWIPYIGDFLSIWALILLVIGFAKTHQMGEGKTFLAIFTLGLIIALIVIMVMGYYFGAFFV